MHYIPPQKAHITLISFLQLGTEPQTIPKTSKKTCLTEFEHFWASHFGPAVAHLISFSNFNSVSVQRQNVILPKLDVFDHMLPLTAIMISFGWDSGQCLKCKLHWTDYTSRQQGSRSTGLPRMIGLFHQPHHDGFDSPYNNMLCWGHVYSIEIVTRHKFLCSMVFAIFRYHGISCKPSHAQLLKRNHEAIGTSLEALANKTRLRTMSSFVKMLRRFRVGFCESWIRILHPIKTGREQIASLTLAFETCQDAYALIDPTVCSCGHG